MNEDVPCRRLDRRFFVILFSLLLYCPSLWAQSGDRTVSGIVRDEKGQGIPGVNVVVKGSQRGTSTDVDGKYRISIADGQNTTLQFSYIGYVSQEVAVTTQSTIDVQLKEEAQSLTEVVVVGYGAQKKSDLTGAVSTVSAKEISRLPLVGVDQALQGKSPGVRVTQNTGAPGEGVSVRIRGTGSINDNNPLYIVDGIPTKDAFSILTPSDIESITILKDASSSAIYGARAANGVVLITTKKGATGSARISFNAYTGLQQHGRLIPMANTDEYVRIYNEAANNDNAEFTNPSLFRKLITPEIQATLPNTDWQKEIFRVAPINNYQMSFSGGTASSRYLISGAYFDQQGIVLNSGYRRYSLKANIDADIAGFIKIGTNLNLTYGERDIIPSSGDGYGGNGGSVVRYALFRTPAIPVYDPTTGDFSDLPARPDLFGDGYNPVGLALKQDNKERQYRAFGNLYGQFQLTKSLIFRTDGGLDLGILNRKRFNENWGTNGRINSPATLTENIGTSTNLTWNNTLNYLKQVGSHDFSVLVGTEAIRNVGRDLTGSDRSFIDQDPNLRYLGRGADPTGRNSYGGDSRWKLFSLFGRVNYNYKGKYLASANFRRDGSSRFPADNRYANFYSGSVGWNIDQEDFFRALQPTMSILKLRASIGQLGNQEIGNYPYASIVTQGFNYPFGEGPAQQPGYTVTSRGNTNVKWETSTQTDVGLDMGFFNNRLQATIDYFLKQTSDILLPVPVPRSGGTAGAPYVNAGRVQNQGIELELTYRNRVRELNYDINANVSYIKNKVLSLGNGQPIPGGRIDNGVFATLTEQGYPIGSFYLLAQDGIFQNQADIFTSAFQGNDIRPGDVKFRDLNGDGVINQLDRSHVGSPIPPLVYGATANLQWRNIDLSVFVQGVSGNQVYYQVATDIEGFYRSFNITKRVVDEHWTGEGTSNTQPRVSWRGATNNKLPSTRFLEDGSFTRLKNVQIGYSLPASLVRKWRMAGARIYVSGQNLLTFTKYPGMDPEQQSSDNLNNEQFRGDVAVGIDWGTYPISRIYTLGINVNF
ncbi:SusC/RagA family TonB-linked outer membrane protein [Fibrella sp. WM1]|uniref:SusC/RagA family TonB-linked outer membrane protein n=1 Tax=Fibrella musci TaxID=3242485 RepID=UPI0035226906